MAWMSPQAWARRCAARPWRTVFTWIALVVISAGSRRRSVSGGLTTASTFTGSPDSKRADDLRSARLGRRCRSETWSSSRPRTAQNTAGAEGRCGGRHDRVAQLGRRSSGRAARPDGGLAGRPKRVAAAPDPGRHRRRGSEDRAGDRRRRCWAQPGYKVFVTGDATLSRDLTDAFWKRLAEGRGDRHPDRPGDPGLRVRRDRGSADSSAAVVVRDRGGNCHHRVDRKRLTAELLCSQHAHVHGACSGNRLQPVCGLAVPRGARPGPRDRGGDRTARAPPGGP